MLVTLLMARHAAREFRFPVPNEERKGDWLVSAVDMPPHLERPSLTDFYDGLALHEAPSLDLLFPSR